MPRKVRVPADPVQNRESQQRSRARHREYVESLEARLREYEEREVQATLEMQQAARRVANINERLMDFLALRGFSYQEIEEFLCSARGGAAHSSSDHSSGTGPWEGATGRRDAQTSSLDSPEAGCASSGYGAKVITQEATTGNQQPTITVCGGAREGPEALRNVTQALVTSCDEAASIIANFQGHGDVSKARGTLGCGSARPCHVKNTRLFQLMDEAG